MPQPNWIKLYLSLLDDPEVRSLPDYLWRRLVELHLLASQGGCGIKLPPPETMAGKLRRPLPALLEDLHKLNQVCLVFQDCAGDWFVWGLFGDEGGSGPTGADGGSISSRSQKNKDGV